MFLFLLFLFLVWKGLYVKIHNIQLKKNILSHNINNIPNQEQKKEKKKNIYVKTDVIDLIINLNNGNIKKIKLLDYQKKINSFKKIKILHKQYFDSCVQNELFQNYSPYHLNITNDLNYISNRIYYKLVNGQKTLYVPLQCMLKNGVFLLKTFIFKAHSYDVDIKYKIINFGQLLLKFSIIGELQYNSNFQLNNDHLNNKIQSIESFENIAYSYDYQKYSRYSFHDIKNNKDLYLLSKSGWISTFQKYFSISWIFYTHEKNIIYTYYDHHHHKETVGYQSPNIDILSGEKYIIQNTLWIGPKIQDKMSYVAPYLNYTVDYGWLWFLSQPFFYILNTLHNFIKNWGYAIMLMTILIRAIIYPLTKSQYSSMIKMKVLEPKIQYLQKKFQNDKTQLSQEILNLYKNKSINPLGNVFSILIQMPFFLALYYTLSNSVELRHTSMFWIHDLSDKDPLYILPIFMGITMFLIQNTTPNNKMNFTNINKTHFISLIFILFFLWFPSGLVLYYIMSNIITIIQQIIMNKYYIKK
ncbi:membrane protein insertase YidC [Buchnera aphidicola (Stegophylla sp.)]|nr:membrane protein insertase YidC [Buchnera aphidicola (Stegophylla sp.)]